MRKAALILFTLLYTFPLWGQINSYKFKHYTKNDGLIENYATAILQDNKGFLWIASTGLNKFDGYKFVNYTNHADDSTSLVNNIIQALFEDSKGRIWVGTKAGVCVYSRETNKFFIPLPKKINSNLYVSSFSSDDSGLIYIGTYGSGLIVYNPADGTYVNYLNKNGDCKSLSDDFVFSITNCKDKGIFIGTSNGLNFFHTKTKTFSRINLPLSTGRTITCMEKDNEGGLWLGQKAGVAYYNINTGECKNYPLSAGNHNSFVYVRTLIFAAKDELWIGTDNGIFTIDTKTGKKKLIQNNFYDTESLASNAIRVIYRDKNDGIWIGTRANGIDRLKFRNERFLHYKKNPLRDSSLSSNEIFGMTEDKNGNIWFATLDGLNKYSRKEDKFTNFFSQTLPGMPTNTLWTVYTNKKIKNDILWVGSESGLFALSLSSGNVINPFRNKSLINSISKNPIITIRIDSGNNLWLGTNSGIIRVNLLTEKIKTFTDSQSDPSGLSNSYTWRLYIDSKNNLWACTINGLNLLRPGSEKFTVFTHNQKDPYSIRSSEVNDIVESRYGYFWIATSNGLNKFYPDKNKFEKVDFRSVPYELICTMQEDSSGALWLGTAQGLVKYDDKNNNYIYYNTEDGIQGNEFTFPSLTSSTGELYFAGINGFNIFHPAKIISNSHVPPVFLTGLTIMNKPVNPGDIFNGRILINNSFEELKEITLNYDENIIGLEFSALDFESPSKNHYTYIMENHESSWSRANNNRIAAYTLEPGKYLFKVKGSNNDKVWNEKGFSLTINILPPWWKTIWFKILLFLISGGLLYSILYIRTRYLSRQKMHLEHLVWQRTAELSKQQAIVKEQAERIQNANTELEQLNSELEQRVIERTEELKNAKEKAEQADKIKSEFLAQMSHEIRSPVNVVLSFSNLIRSEIEDKIDEDLREGFKSISNAGKRIIRTVDLLLNMSEIQTRTYEFIPEKLSLVEDILYSILPEYQLSAKEKSLQLKLENNALKGNIIGDNYTLEQIFANLIDNAIKYTITGSICIKVFNDEDEALVCEISDTGIGIGEEFMDKIFNPFTQEEQGYTRKFEGNGLGLALVKKYCELNGIDISVKSIKGEGTTFILKFNRTV